MVRARVGQDLLGGSAGGNPTQVHCPPLDIELDFEALKQGRIVEAISTDHDIVC
jgi:hypothetical protein